MRQNCGPINPQAEQILLAVKATGKKQVQQAEELSALATAAGIPMTPGSARNAIAMMSYVGDDRLLSDGIRMGVYNSPISKIKHTAAVRYLRAATDASKVQLADLAEAYQKEVAAAAHRKAEREAKKAGAAINKAPVVPHYQRAVAPGIWQIAPCDQGEMHTLATIIACTTQWTSITAVKNALNGIRTRNTRRYKGNTDYFDEVRKVAIALCNSRAKGTPWPVVKTVAVHQVDGQPTGQGLRSGTYQELQALTAEMRQLRDRNAALELNNTHQDKELASLQEQAVEVGKALDAALDAAQAERKQLQARVHALESEVRLLKSALAVERARVAHGQETFKAIATALNHGGIELGS